MTSKQSAVGVPTPNDTTKFYRGDGTWQVPPSGATTWTAWPGTFTATPASATTVTLTQDVTATIKTGFPVQYVRGAVTYYGLVVAITANLLTLSSPSLTSPSGDITSLKYGDPTRVVALPFLIPGLFNDGNDSALITNDLGMPYTWPFSTAYCVRARFRNRVVDATSAATVNAVIGGSNLLGSNTSLSTTAMIPAYDVGQNMDADNYVTYFGDAIELTTTKAGTGDSQELTAELTFVVG